LQISDILRLIRFQFDLESPTLFFKQSSDLFESFFGSYMNERRIFLSAKFRCFLKTDSSQPILAIDKAFHLANIGNSISHTFTISNIAELSHCRVSGASGSRLEEMNVKVALRGLTSLDASRNHDGEVFGKGVSTQIWLPPNLGQALQYHMSIMQDVIRRRVRNTDSFRKPLSSACSRLGSFFCAISR
jgi:hypothetical protein